ncbi:MAG: DUF115 domain-containing protein [Treponema sp.]|nr:DUF115 domain-containing protein [Treponema sp.]
MNRNNSFKKNLLALSVRNPGLSARLEGAQCSDRRYIFSLSRTGEIVPALADGFGNTRALHSMIDPKREGERLIAASAAGSEDSGSGFLVFLGLGGGYAIEAAFDRLETTHVAVIDFDLCSIVELFSAKDYSKILADPRFSLWIDPDLNELKSFILGEYRPVLCGGIRVVPLRARTEQDHAKFDLAAAAIKNAVEKVRGDYSVQAHFGLRWFSNIIRNIKNIKATAYNFPPIQEAAVCGAGPSLDTQIPLLAKMKARRVFIISSDTAFPALRGGGIEPDAVVSIDCQHISYYHFIGSLLGNIPLLLDVASPPMASRLSASPFFFSCAHPLAHYISRYWQPLPALDTSGGNVTHACLSLAEILGARRITLFGCDFSYPRGRTYARGAYIYPFFMKKQNRLVPLEAHLSSLLYRAPFLPREGAANYYETESLRFYRKALEAKAESMAAEVIAAEGIGAPLNLRKGKQLNAGMNIIDQFSAGTAGQSSTEFLRQYRNAIAALPSFAHNNLDNYYRSLKEADRQVFTTLLPLAAALNHRQGGNSGLLIEKIKYLCIEKIESVLTNESFSP